MLLAVIDGNGSPQALHADYGYLPVALMVWDSATETWKRWAGSSGGAAPGGLTDVELRAVPVAVAGPLTNAELRAAAVPVSLASGGPFAFVSAKTAAPLANAVQCDTGALPAGDYELEVQLSIADTLAVGKGLVVEHRNAANNANINVLGGCTAGETVDISIAKVTLSLNERIRVIAGTAAGAASSMYVSAIGRRLAS